MPAVKKIRSVKEAARLRRKVTIRKKVTGTAERPRLTVFRSAKHIYAQAIDDDVRSDPGAELQRFGVDAKPGTAGERLPAEKLVTRPDSGEHLEDLVADSGILAAFTHERRTLPGRQFERFHEQSLRLLPGR